MHDDPPILELARSQHSLITTHQLRRLGVPERSVERFDTSRGWEPVTSVVLRRSGSAITLEQQAMAAVLDSGGDSRFSHLPAARWWGLEGCAQRPFHVVRTTNTRRRCELAVVHRVRVLPDRWVTELRGVPIVSTELLAVQLFAVCGDARRAERLVDRLWSARLLSGRSIAACLADLGERGRNGIAGLRRYLDERGLDFTPPASGLESRVSEILRLHDIPMRSQVDVGADRWTGRVDFLHERLPVVLEVQSAKFHTALTDQRADDARRTALRAAGFAVAEVWDDDVWSRPAAVVAAVRDAIDSL